MSSPVKVRTDGRLSNIGSTETLGPVGDISFGDTDIAISFATATAAGQGKDLTLLGCIGAANQTGGFLTIQSGAGGTGNADSGDLTLDVGSPAGSGTAGNISIGTSQTSGITIGNSTNLTYFSCPVILAPVEEFVAGENLTKGAPISLANASGVPKAYLCDADGPTVERACIGLVFADALSAATFYVQIGGQLLVPDAIWDAVPATTDVGKHAYLSETRGHLTITAPVTGGSTVASVGVISQGGTGAVKVMINPERGTVL